MGQGARHGLSDQTRVSSLLCTGMKESAGRGRRQREAIMGEQPILTFDRSAINRLADDRDCDALLAGVASGFYVFNGPGVSEESYACTLRRRGVQIATSSADGQFHSPFLPLPRPAKRLRSHTPNSVAS